MTDLRFATTLRCARLQVWEWITSVAGLSAEMRPYFRMTTPPGVERLTDLKIELGKPLFRSQVYLFGVLPAGCWDLTLVALDDGRGFVEQSPSFSMRTWRHERRIHDVPGDLNAVRLEDHLTFEPRVASALTAAFVRRAFAHRHRVLRERLSQE